MPSRKSIAELLNRRRRQILVHSIIYYKMNDNLISDSTWSAWATELEELQAEYPEIAAVINPTLPDEKFRRVGQSAAAASLPEV